MATEHSFGDISGLKQSDADIRHIFSRHIKMLFDTKWKISDEMTEWSKKLINQIQEYVAQQRDLLEQEYARKVTCLNILRDHVLEQALKYEEQKDTEHIDELINQCNAVKVELAMLVYIERPIPSIQLITDEQQLVQPTDNESTVQNIQDEQSPKEFIENTISNSSTYENLPSEQPSTNSPTKSTVDEDQSISNHERSEMTITRRDDLNDKCPICYMIFPQSMTVHNRNLHVNEHYNDD